MSADTFTAPRGHLVPEGDLKAFRVKPARPCPVCGHGDWCLAGDDWAICKRAESAEPWGEAGWLHRLDGSTAAPRERRQNGDDAGARAVANRTPATLSAWAEDRAEATFGGLPLASSDPAVLAFLGHDYGLAPEAVPADVRIWCHPDLGRGLVYQVRSAEGDLAYFFKSIKRNGKKKRESRWLLGGEGALILKGPAGAPLVIVSGAEKGMAAHAAGFTVLAFMQGEAKLPDAWIRNIVALRPSTVIVANDADETGAKANAATSKALEVAGVPVDRLRIAPWPRKAPKGADLNDVLKGGGADALREFLEAATPAPSILPRIQTAAQLQVETFRPPKWIIDGLRPEGLTIICAKPKKGKSWMELANSLAVAAGVPALGRFATAAGDTLYLALEDSARRFQSRIATLIGADVEWPKRLHVCYQWARLDQGGLEMLSVWLRSHPEAAMIVIDTFTRVKAPKGKNEESYQHDAECTAALQRLALEHGVAIVLVHHQRKAGSDDIFDTFSGTLGITASADVLLALEVKKGKGKLTVTGRDLPEAVWSMAFDGGRWTCLGEAEPEDDDDAEDPVADAKEFLVELLKGGSLDSEEIFKQGASQGIAKKKIYEAKKALRVKARPSGLQGGWIWYPPCTE